MLSFGMGSITLAVLFSLGIGIEFDPLDSRTTIFGENANNVGINMSISLIIIFLTLIQNRLALGRIRYFLIAGIPFLFITMIGTGSRVSFIAFLLAFMVFITLFKSKNKWSKPVIITFGIFALFFIWQYFLKSEEITLRLIRSLQEGDVSNRDIIWKAVFPIWLENPLFGIGTTGYEYLSFNTYGRFVSPHNVILEILCYSGITGLLLYSIFLFRVTQIGYLTFRVYNYLLPVLILIPIWGYLLSAQLLRVKFGWIIFAYVVANSIYVTGNEKINTIAI
jgi:O-antigen ligase